MKKVTSFILGAICFLAAWLFLGYGNRAVHPELNSSIVIKFQDIFVTTAFPLEKFKNYTFSYEKTSLLGFPGTEVNTGGLTDFTEQETEKNARGWIVHGGYSADEPEIFQSFRHFYDPTEPAGNRYLHNHLDTSEDVNPKVDQVEWALTNPEHVYNWENGLLAMGLALTNASEEMKALNYAVAYRALGETLHMIADMGLPAHVRDDSHPAPLGKEGLGRIFGSPDPYEEFFEEFWDIGGNFYQGKTDLDLRSAFRRLERVDSIAIKMAEYTNRNYFSDQTISGNGVTPLIRRQKTYALPQLQADEYDDLTYTYKKNISGNEVIMCKDKRFGLFSKRGYPYIDKECTLSQGQALVPQILEAGANVIRLFIPELKVEITTFDENSTTISGKVLHKKSYEYFKELKYAGKVSIYDANSRSKIVDVDCVNGVFEQKINLKDFKKVDWNTGIYGQIEFGGIFVKSEPFKQGLSIETNPVTKITETTATSGGNITSDGSFPVTDRGVCWSKSPNPTTADSHTSDGSGTGAFVSNLTGLTVNTLYYVRAYAVNSKGTLYGNEVSFTAKVEDNTDILAILHKLPVIYVNLYADLQWSELSAFPMGQTIVMANNSQFLQKEDESLAFPVVWSGTSFTATGEFNDKSYEGVTYKGTIEFTGTVSPDGRTLLTFSAKQTQNYVSTDQSSWERVEKLAGNNIPMEYCYTIPPYSNLNVTYSFSGKELQSRMSAIAYNHVDMDMNGTITRQFLYSFTQWDSDKYVPKIQVSFWEK